MLIDRLAAGLTDRGHRAAVLCGGPVGERPYEVVDTGGTFGQYVGAPLAYWRRFRDWDLVVDVENGVPFFVPLWRRGPSLCLVHHVHRDQWITRFPAPIARFGWFLERRVMPRVHRRSLFVAVSVSTSEALQDIGVDPGRIRLLTNGVDLDIAPCDADSEPLFVMLGRLVPHKRVELVLEAWARVQPVIGGRLLIAGSGPEHDRLRSLSGAGVEFLGHVSESEKQQLLRRAWFLVHGAHHEGWGIVTVEAAAQGRPTLAFDVPGVRDAVANGETGILVRSLDEMAEEWIALAGDRQRRDRLGQAARARAEALSWPATIDAFLAIAEESLAAKLSGR
jgi:glycosyltransferase involved in cell wall biosynthesis